MSGRVSAREERGAIPTANAAVIACGSGNGGLRPAKHRLLHCRIMGLPAGVPAPLPAIGLRAEILNHWVDFRPRPSTFNHMVELQMPQMNSVFHALGDATRRQMLRDLADGEQTVSDLAKPFAMSLAAASKHIR